MVQRITACCSTDENAKYLGVSEAPHGGDERSGIAEQRREEHEAPVIAMRLPVPAQNVVAGVSPVPVQNVSAGVSPVPAQMWGTTRGSDRRARARIEAPPSAMRRMQRRVYMSPGIQG